MRTPRAIACAFALVVALSVAAPAAIARPSTPAERVAAANAFAQRTLSFAGQQSDADREARLALAARRGVARSCLAVWQSAPLAVRNDLGLVYFEYLSGHPRK